jgi:serine/threonine protein kinase
MPTPRQYAVLGPLDPGSETRALLGCEVVAGVPRRDLPLVVVWIPAEVSGDPKRIARLQRETAFVTQLSHPHVIRVFGLECFEQGWARVVAFVDGEPLEALLRRARERFRPIDPRIAARIMVDLCEGVHYAHEEGQQRYAGRPIVHGGLRPDTVMVGFGGLSLVTGYGASVLSPGGAGPFPASLLGYLAPEQVIGGRATASPATDIYALGALLHELLAGKAPFADAADRERAVLTTEPPLLDVPGLAGRLANVAATALAKRGSDRFESAEVMRDAILAAVAADGVELPTHAEVAQLLGELIPPASPERLRRQELLESTRNLDGVAQLERPTEAPSGVDAENFATWRAHSGIGAVAPSSRPRKSAWPEATGATLRAPLAREEKTVIEAPPLGTVPSPGGHAPSGAAEDAPPSEPLRAAAPREAVTVVEDPAALAARGARPRTPPVPPPLEEAPPEDAEGHVVATREASASAEPSGARPSPAPDEAQAATPTAELARSQAEPPHAEPARPELSLASDLGARAAEDLAPPAASPSAVSTWEHAVRAAEPVPLAAAAAVPAVPVPGFTGAAGASQPPARVSSSPGLAPWAQPPGVVPSSFPGPAHPASVDPVQLQTQPPQPPLGGITASLPGFAPPGTLPGFAPAAPPTGHPPFAPPGTMPGPVSHAGLAAPMSPAGVPASNPAGVRPIAPPPSGAEAFDPLLANVPVQNLPPSTQRAPREESRITQFNKSAGDNSRSILFLVLAAAAALILFVVLLPKEPPPELAEAPAAPVVPKSVVREALENAPRAEPEAQFAPAPEAALDAGTAPETTAPAAGEERPAEGVMAKERMGRLELASDPAVDVYLGNERLGRSPVSVQLPAGKYKLRLTDKDTGINLYRSYEVRAGETSSDSLTIGSSQLVVEAPARSVITLNARALGTAPIEPVTIYEGEYLLRVTLDGMTWTERFDAPPGRQIQFKVNLGEKK